jgi:hypothetical protein
MNSTARRNQVSPIEATGRETQASDELNPRLHVGLIEIRGQFGLGLTFSLALWTACGSGRGIGTARGIRGFFG